MAIVLSFPLLLLLLVRLILLLLVRLILTGRLMLWGGRIGIVAMIMATILLLLPLVPTARPWGARWWLGNWFPLHP